MSAEHEREPDSEARPAPEDEAARRRRMAAIFGEPLPERTRDELSEGEEQARGGAGDEEWLRSQVPPHHG